MWESDIGHRARTYFLLRRFTEAEKTYKRAIQIATDTNDRDWLVLWLAELTSVYIETGDYQSADILNVQGLQKADFKKDSFRANRAFLNDARLKRLEGHFGEAETALEKLQNEPADEKDPKIIWELHVERAQLLADLNRVPQAREEFEAALRTGNNVRNSISLDDYRLTYFLPLRGIYESYVDFLVKHEQPEQALRISELGHARMLAEKLNMAGPQNSKLDFRKIAKAKNAVILSYSIAPKESYMWVTTGDSVTCLPMPADTSKKLETRIANHNEQIRYEQRSIEEDTGGNALYNTLIAPASSLIGSAKNIIVIPDGPLASLNFETLIPPGEKKHYWIESVRITVTPSFNLLRAERPQWAEPTSALLVGDAIPTARENLPPLGHDDLDYIQNLYPTKCDVLRKGQATPKEFLKAAKAKQYSWIYLSAHARSFSQSPLDSYIVLTPETAGGDYKLSARDLAKVGLKAELVTLSACQSAGAKNMPGEGLVGLSWTVLGDGARNVLASLWNVGVDQTTKLMEKFYRHMKAHESPSEALQAAKIEMIKENELPYSWAAFQLYSR
jgi:CHAT domain-containing protein